jgi:hypothetical protein
MNQTLIEDNSYRARDLCILCLLMIGVMGIYSLFNLSNISFNLEHSITGKPITLTYNEDVTYDNYVNNSFADKFFYLMFMVVFCLMLYAFSERSDYKHAGIKLVRRLNYLEKKYER